MNLSTSTKNNEICWCGLYGGATSAGLNSQTGLGLRGDSFLLLYWVVWGCIGADMHLPLGLLWVSMLVGMVLYVGGKVRHGGDLEALMGLSWGRHGAATGLSRGSHGALMGLSWGSHRALVGFSWFFHGVVMELPCCS